MAMLKLKRSLNVVASVLSAAFVACAAFVGAGLTPATHSAYANSGPSKEFGVTSAGVIVREDASALAVESEKLTFDIRNFPALYDEPSTAEYAASVTAEYKFVNTSANTICTSMAFPVGCKPHYYYEYYYEQSDIALFDTPTIMVDGKVIDCEVRHTLGEYKDFDAGVAEIYDGWYEDGFYSPDMPVTEYIVKVDKGVYPNVIAVGTVNCDTDRARVLCDHYNGNILIYYEESELPDSVIAESGAYSFIVVGDKTAFECEWKTRWRTADRYGDVNLPVEVTEVDAPFSTLRELILYRRGDRVSSVSDMDYYNAVASHLLYDGERAGNTQPFLAEGTFCAWYTYETEVAPRGSFINTVTAPLYPTVLYTTNPYSYSYEYYLSPALKWKDFGELEVEIRTPYYLLEASAEFVQEDGVYRAKFSQLPRGELSFVLCAEARPLNKFFGFWVDWSKVKRNLTVAAGVFLGGSVVAAVVVSSVIVLTRRKK